MANPFITSGLGAPEAPGSPTPASAPTEGGANPFITSGMGPAAPEQQDAGGGGGGILGGLAKVAAPGLHLLSAPGQVVEHGIAAGREAITGHFGAAAGELGQAALKGATFGQAGKDISFTQAIGAKKLPFGLETLGSIATDPLTYLTFGVGSAGSAGLHAAEDVAGAGARDLIKQGGLRALEEAQPGATEALRNRIVERAGDVGAEKANHIADRQMEALAARGQGGIGYHVPGTDVAGHIAGSFERGPVAYLASKLPEGVRAAFNPEMEAALHEQAGVGNRMQQGVVGKQFNQALQKMTGFYKKSALAFPGTVVNRMRRTGILNFSDMGSARDVLEYTKEGTTLRHAVDKSAQEVGGAGIESIEHDAKKLIDTAQREADKWDAARAGGVPAETPTPRAAQDAAEAAVAKEKQAVAAERAAGKSPRKVNQRYLQVSRAAREAAGTGEGVPRPNVPTYEDAMEQVAPGFKQHLAGQVGEERATHIMGYRARETGMGIYGGGATPGGLGKRLGANKIYEAGHAVEHDGRVANYLWNLDNRYGDMDRAATHTKMIQGDAKALTQFEREHIAKFMPFWGAYRSHLQSVLALTRDNTQTMTILNHLLANTPLGIGTGYPTGQFAEAATVPLGAANALGGGAVDLARGHYKDAGATIKSNLGLALGSAESELGGPRTAALKLLLNSGQLSKDPLKQAKTLASGFVPVVSRIPVPGEKKSLAQRAVKAGLGVQIGG